MLFPRIVSLDSYYALTSHWINIHDLCFDYIKKLISFCSWNHMEYNQNMFTEPLHCWWLKLINWILYMFLPHTYLYIYNLVHKWPTECNFLIAFLDRGFDSIKYVSHNLFYIKYNALQKFSGKVCFLVHSH